VIVGLNLLYLLPGVVGGTETYGAGLVHGLSNLDDDARFVVYCNRESSDWPLPADPRFSRVVCPVQASSRAARYWYEQRMLPRRVRADRIDVLHSLGYVAPLALGCPSVVTVPDMHYLVHGRPLARPRRLLLSYFVRKSIARAAAVIAISRFTRDALIRTYRLPPDMVDVVLLAPKPRVVSTQHPASETLKALGIRKPYMLAFGGMTPNKNIDRLLKSYQLARQRYGVEQDLVVIGRLPGGMASLAAPGVIATDYLADEVVATLLRSAVALLFPSLYEGFGLPVLEAMTAGVAVVCSNAAAIPEVAADAALYFDPLDVAEMAEKTARICQDESLRKQLAIKGLARVEEFSWERTASQTLAIYRRVLSSPGPLRVAARDLG
jgi:glycosyltransferase involved in cell wall biosynthesis